MVVSDQCDVGAFQKRWGGLETARQLRSGQSERNTNAAVKTDEDLVLSVLISGAGKNSEVGWFLIHQAGGVAFLWLGKDLLVLLGV